MRAGYSLCGSWCAEMLKNRRLAISWAQLWWFFYHLICKKIEVRQVLDLIFQYKKNILERVIHVWHLPHKTPLTKDKGHSLLLIFYEDPSLPSSLSPTLCPEEIKLKTFLSTFFEVSQNPRPHSLFPSAILGTLIAICTLHANFND